MDAPRLATEKLLAHVLGCERIDLYTRFEQALPPDAIGRFRDLVRRRAAREPIQHLIGGTEFWSLAIQCDARALVPRPETELVVRAVLDAAHDRTGPAVADIGTGTGCIAVAVAKELPEASVVASDVSADALVLAAENLKANDLAERVRLIEGDLAQPFLAEGLEGCFDIVASNPPYVTDADLETLDPEVRDHDPRLALAGGEDGLDVIRRLSEETPSLLKENGFLIMEIGHDQAGPVRDLLAASGWRVETTLPDGAGIERVVVAQREQGG